MLGGRGKSKCPKSPSPKMNPTDILTEHSEMTNFVEDAYTMAELILLQITYVHTNLEWSLPSVAQLSQEHCWWMELP